MRGILNRVILTLYVLSAAGVVHRNLRPLEHISLRSQSSVDPSQRLLQSPARNNHRPSPKTDQESLHGLLPPMDRNQTPRSQVENMHGSPPDMEQRLSISPVDENHCPLGNEQILHPQHADGSPQDNSRIVQLISTSMMNPIILNSRQLSEFRPRLSEENVHKEKPLNLSHKEELLYRNHLMVPMAAQDESLMPIGRIAGRYCISHEYRRGSPHCRQRTGPPQVTNASPHWEQRLADK